MSQEFLEVIPILVIFLSAGVAVNVGFQIFGRKLITYHLEERSLDIRVGQSYRLIAVPYSTILSVQAVSVVGSMFELRNLRLFNRTIGGAVVIDQTSGPRILITPDDPEHYAQMIRTRAAEASQGPLAADDSSVSASRCGNAPGNSGGVFFLVVKKLVSVPVLVSLYLLIFFCLMFYLSGRPTGTVGRGGAWIAGIALVVIFFVLVFQSHGRHNTILVLRWLAILLVAVLAVNLVQVIVVWTVPDADGFSAQFGRGCISGAASIFAFVFSGAWIAPFNNKNATVLVLTVFGMVILGEPISAQISDPMMLGELIALLATSVFILVMAWPGKVFGTRGFFRD